MTGRVVLADHGYAITLAAGWQRIDFGGDLVAQVLAAGGSADYASQFPALKDQLVASGLSIFALRRPDTHVSAGTTLTVQDNAIATVPLHDYEAVVKSQLQTTLGPDTKITATRVDAPAGTFLRMSYQLVQSAQTITNIHYFLVSSGKQIVTTCSSPGTSPSLVDECDAIATSLEILP